MEISGNVEITGQYNEKGIEFQPGLRNVREIQIIINTSGDSTFCFADCYGLCWKSLRSFSTFLLDGKTH